MWSELADANARVSQPLMLAAYDLKCLKGLEHIPPPPSRMTDQEPILDKAAKKRRHCGANSLCEQPLSNMSST